MNESFGKVVYPVINTALKLKAELDANKIKDSDVESRIDKAQRDLVELLRAGGEIRGQVDYTGDGGVFLGARYALACWIDELFNVHAPALWADRWKERILEVDLFGHGDSAWRFWEQLDIVLRHPNVPRPSVAPGLDAMETFFLCVALGFRGKYLDEPAKVREYLDEMRPQLIRVRSFDEPRDVGVQTNVEPPGGQQKLRRVALVYGSAFFVLVLVDVFLSRFWWPER
jgi:type VI secretion system protein ImpK